MSSSSTEQPPFQFTLRSLMAITAAAAMLFGIVVYIRDQLFFSDPPQPGAVANPLDWPDSLQELLSDARKANIEVGSARLYSLDKRYVIDTEHYLEMRASPELLALIAKRWPVTPATKRDVDAFWRAMPAGWAIAGNPSSKHYSVWGGHKSDNVMVMVDDQTNLVYVLYYFNF